MNRGWGKKEIQSHTTKLLYLGRISFFFSLRVNVIGQRGSREVYVCTSEFVIITGNQCKTKRKFLELYVNKCR